MSYGLGSCCSSVEGRNQSPARPAAAGVVFQNLGAACPKKTTERAEATIDTTGQNKNYIYTAGIVWILTSHRPDRSGDHSPITINLTTNNRAKQMNKQTKLTILMA